MRKFCTIAMAFVLALCLTQCKKTELTNDTPTNENPTDSTTVASGETVFITLKVSQDNDSRLEVDPPHVYFEEGDKIYVASNGKYVGTMTYSSETKLFSANIVASQVASTQPLHFYLLGNKTPTEPLTIGTTTSCTINISDQTEYLPVVSYAPSNEKFNETTEFTAILRNQCALVRFDVTTPSTSPICITGMKNKVTVNFTQNTMTPSKEGEGVIMLPAGSGENVEKWAILLPQEEALEEGEEGSAYSKDGAYQGTRPNIPIIQKNAYITDAIAVSVTNVVDPNSLSLPTVATVSATDTDITTSTAICRGTISGENIGVITEYGISYSTINGFEGSTGTHINGWDLNSSGSFTANLTGLNDNYTYYYRAYATNAKGTVYGDIKSFQTLGADKPVVVTLSVTPISGTSAIGECEVTSDGGATVIARGICWSTNQYPTIDNDPYTNSGTGIGNYSATLTELQPGTTYYVRAFATNSKGTSYDEEIIVLNMPVLPWVTTSDVTNITATSATSGGEVTSDGGATVTERGICWSTNQNPTIEDTHVSTGNGTGEFTVNMTGLNSNTTYYMRAYAINIVGIQYGAEKSFTTLALIEVSANPSEGGSVIGHGEYQQGESCTVKALHNNGYAFINWTENGEEVSTDAEYTFEVTSNRNLVANFIPEYTITVSPNALGVGTVTGGGTYLHGQSCTVTAIPNDAEGYIFFYWLENGEPVPYADAVYTFEVTSDRTLVAFFIKPIKKDAD